MQKHKISPKKSNEKSKPLPQRLNVSIAVKSAMTILKGSACNKEFTDKGKKANK